MTQYNDKGYDDRGVHWADYANCQDPDAPTMFPADGDETGVQMALEVCGGCPVMGICRQAALDNSERFGIWGGTTPKQRDRMIRNKRASVIQRVTS